MAASVRSRMAGAVMAGMIGLVFTVVGLTDLPSALTALLNCLSATSVSDYVVLSICVATTAILWAWMARDWLLLIQRLGKITMRRQSVGDLPQQLKKRSFNEKTQWSRLDRKFVLLASLAAPVLIVMGQCDQCGLGDTVQGTCLGRALSVLMPVGVIVVLGMVNIHIDYLCQRERTGT